MLEELEGRLSWEKKPDGIVVHIPSRRGSMFLLFGPVLGVWLLFAAARYSYTVGQNNLSPDEAQSALIWLIVAGFGVSFVILLFWAAWAFTSESMLTLDQTSFKIQHRVLGIEVMTKTYPTADAHNFRFIPPGGYSGSRSVVDPRTSKIQFKVGPRTCTFAAGVTSLEALTLMERMQEVYKFTDFEKPRT
jgi:hypothetical protein